MLTYVHAYALRETESCAHIKPYELAFSNREVKMQGDPCGLPVSSTARSRKLMTDEVLPEEVHTLSEGSVFWFAKIGVTLPELVGE